MKQTSSPESLAAYNEVVEQLSHEAPTVASQMFGMPCIKLDGKALCGLFGDTMTFKLPPEEIARALAIPGAIHFDPMGGRPMKQWVQVPVSQSGQWIALAKQSLAFLQH